MLKKLLKGAALKRMFGFGRRHKKTGIGALLAALGWRNRGRFKALGARR